MTTLLILLAILLVIVLWLVGAYNGLVRLKNRVKNMWSQIDVQLKRRHDLIPNLIETVKGYMTHEREVLENITSYRAQAMDAKTVGEKAQAEGMLGQALGKLQVAVEAYPDLKANQNFLSLQEELASTENRIAFSRQAYNDSVMSFNNKIEMFPSNIVAKMFSFNQEEFFEIEDPQEKVVPKVDFSL
ncbi:MAG: LemA family protein [Bacteroidales bacterium]|nr:LemA family protein [Bacteroidales bacterium]